MKYEVTFLSWRSFNHNTLFYNKSQISDLVAFSLQNQPSHNITHNSSSTAVSACCSSKCMKTSFFFHDFTPYPADKTKFLSLNDPLLFTILIIPLCYFCIAQHPVSAGSTFIKKARCPENTSCLICVTNCKCSALFFWEYMHYTLYTTI